MRLVRQRYSFWGTLEHAARIYTLMWQSPADCERELMQVGRDGKCTKGQVQMSDDESHWHALQDAKFREIADLIAVSLGYGSFDALGAEEKLAVELETREAIERWEEIAEMMMPSVEPKNSLQKLLREHHDIGEAILDIRDEEEEQKMRRRGPRPND